MKTSLIILILLTAGCTGAASPRGGSTEPPEGIDVVTQADIYAALVGDRGENFGTMLISSEICTDAGSPAEHVDCEPMSQELRAALELRLPQARVVGDPQRWMDRIFENGGQTLHSFGPIEGTGDEVKVGYSYYCGGLCASGGTAVVELVDGKWEVTGSVGPSWIS